MSASLATFTSSSACSSALSARFLNPKRSPFIPVRHSLQPRSLVRHGLSLGSSGRIRVLPWQARIHAATADQESTGTGSMEEDVSITMRNDPDDEMTVIEILGKNDKEFLMKITGALGSLDLQVHSATIETKENGAVNDVFRVTDANREKIPDENFNYVRDQLFAAIRSTSMSGFGSRLPVIYGMAAAAEVERLRPLSEQNGDNSAAALELAAAEMSQAAANLVSIERDIIAMMKDGSAAESAIGEKEKQRAEATSLLERQMAAMEAAMKKLRAPREAEKPPQEERHQGADLRFGTLGGGTGTGAAAGDGFEIFLQGFNWDSCNQAWYKKLMQELSFIKDSGITTVWLPPPTDSVSPQGYLPRDLYNLNTPYGSEGELRELNRMAHDLGLKTVADIVINHRCASAQGPDGKWNKFGGRLPWDSSVITSDSHEFGGHGARSTGQVYAAAPNIDHTQEHVRKDYADWLRWLRNSIGFDGWRLDFVIGYAGSYVKEYVDASVPELAFGEYWDTCAYEGSVLQYNQDAHRQRTVNWIDSTGGTAAAFDFTTKGILQEAVGRNERWRLVDPKGKPPGVIGMWPSRSITFIDNHDTGSSLQHWPFPPDHLEEGYCYILTHPGSPCVFYDHFFAGGLGDKIRELIKLRKRNKINARSKIVIVKAVGDLYAATIDEKVHMKIGHGDWSPNHANLGGEWNAAVTGKDFAVWERK
uniref:alpha-amylase n=1 Tax=Tetraselmis sp. GSL018 TaxID=582737 RepID=A0A061QGW0_9CHLO|eukprot:CAMPEP_0177609008 /NCGR_PEP_ID=MMETSP0419_2-20121207/18814_1 /TAXON_ID=582737 /ORGANISM="Tetraselmis sp., Strain GSL018" /LENGTH=704 /DNA_ID=CAMNT_0019103813 /DNA_START=100 /DNA_END=2214 /DNA_ORIENTATION=-